MEMWELEHKSQLCDFVDHKLIAFSPVGCAQW